MQTDPLHPIRVVCARTGLSAHAIRAWERRYQALTPERSGTNRRLYSDAEIEKLKLLRQLIGEGYSIGEIARIDVEGLRRLAEKGTEAADAGQALPPDEDRWEAAPLPEAEGTLRQCLETMTNLDPAGLEQSLLRGQAQMSRRMLIEQVVAPLVRQIGERWGAGRLRVAHEHAASAVLRTFLGGMLGNEPWPRAPILVMTTPANQLHELGALMVGALAVGEGWRILYLGPNLPAEEVAAVATMRPVRAVGLSIIYPADDARLPGELVRLRRLLPPNVALLAGGHAAPSYRQALEEAGAELPASFDRLRAVLSRIREG